MIAAICILGYLVLIALVARNRYPHLRPLSVPMCGRTDCYHEHYQRCYRQPETEGWMVDSRREAAVLSLLVGLAWPMILPVLLMMRAVMAGNDGQRPAEMQARIAELEDELNIR
jgi:hypothetical protein